MLLSISLMFVLACLPDTFSGSSGTITYPPTGDLYDRNIKCFFKITVPEGQKIKIKFEQFDFAPGYNYNIERRNSDSTTITKKFVGDNFQGTWIIITFFNYWSWWSTDQITSSVWWWKKFTTCWAWIVIKVFATIIAYAQILT